MGKNRAANFKISLQRGDFNLQNQCSSIREKNFPTFLETFEIGTVFKNTSIYFRMIVMRQSFARWNVQLWKYIIGVIFRFYFSEKFVVRFPCTLEILYFPRSMNANFRERRNRLSAERYECYWSLACVAYQSTGNTAGNRCAATCSIDRSPKQCPPWRSEHAPSSLHVYAPENSLFSLQRKSPKWRNIYFNK